MKVIDKKDNFFAIAVQEGEKVVIADGNGQIQLQFVVSEDCIINAYRKTEVRPLSYQ